MTRRLALPTAIATVVVLTACQTPPPPADKTVRIDIYNHTSGLGIIESVLRLIPLP